MPEDIRLPIKVVVPAQADFQRPHGGGGSRKMFGNVTPQVRSRFLYEMQLVQEHFFGGLERPSVLPVVAKVMQCAWTLNHCVTGKDKKSFEFGMLHVPPSMRLQISSEHNSE